MNGKTKSILNWVLAFVVAGIVMLLIQFPEAFGAYSSVFQKAGYMLADPSMILIGFATRSAINQFGGGIGMEGFNAALVLATTGVVIIFVLAPTLMFLGYKEAEKSVNKLRSALWHLGAGIVIVAIGYSFYTAFIWSAEKNDVMTATDQQHRLDELQFELIDLYYDASTKAILPQEKGGGGGHFTTFIANDGSTRPIQLSDLDRYNPDSKFDFVISENISDSTITIIGISNLEGNNPDFLNADG
ncbi:MAG: hypothetical protein GVY07_12630, partial [Bacteroidetes bacterium]|nr:hypothetical protein [Bacteroidota bacterium]